MNTGRLSKMDVVKMKYFIQVNLKFLREIIFMEGIS